LVGYTIFRKYGVTYPGREVKEWVNLGAMALKAQFRCTSYSRVADSRSDKKCAAFFYNGFQGLLVI
jgi:hypothetical protein